MAARAALDAGGVMENNSYPSPRCRIITPVMKPRTSARARSTTIADPVTRVGLVPGHGNENYHGFIAGSLSRTPGSIAARVPTFSQHQPPASTNIQQARQQRQPTELASERAPSSRPRGATAIAVRRSKSNASRCEAIHVVDCEELADKTNFRSMEGFV